MSYAAHHVELARTGPDGAAQRATWELAAARGNADARRKLEGPDFPEHMAHLWEWVRDLHGRSGVGMAGLAPLSHQEIEAWQRLTGIVLEPLEVEALIALDGALSGAKIHDEGEAEDVTASAPTPAWPVKKRAHG
jgi:hypothetical protein